MGRIIVIGATKGGVGKTTTTYNLAYSLVHMGKRGLAVDFDSQANLTTCFGVEKPETVEVQQFLAEQQQNITEYDEQLVRRLIEKITVYDERVTVEFKSGTSVDVKR